MNDYWSMLKIAPTGDLKAVKRAYAIQLKAHRPEDSAEYFQRLREAYEWVCQIGVHYLDDDDDSYHDDRYDAPIEAAPEALDFADTARSGPNVAEAEPLLAVTQSEFTVILPSVPTAFPTTFVPPASPSFPLITQSPPEPTHQPAAQTVATKPEPLNTAFSTGISDTDFASHLESFPLRTRSTEQVLSALWAHSHPAKTISEIQAWLQMQAEYESLQWRPKLESALREAFTAQPWPWPTVLAIAELLDWGTIGNLVEDKLNRAVQLAQLQQRAALTVKPRWYQFHSKSAVAHFLISPFSWRTTLLSALLPRTNYIDEIFDEVEHAGVDPEQVFNPQQIEFQRRLRELDFNWPRISYALMRLIAWPLLFSLLFAGADFFAPLAGFVLGIASFVIWVGFVANRLLFRQIWTPSDSELNKKTFWLCWGITLAIAGIGVALDSPTVALMLTAFMLLAVARTILVAIATGAGACFLTLITTAALWPAMAQEKFASTLPITLSAITVCLYLIQRRMPVNKLLSQLARAPRPQPSALTVEGFNWWWLIVAAALARVFGSGL